MTQRFKQAQPFNYPAAVEGQYRAAVFSAFQLLKKQVLDQLSEALPRIAAQRNQELGYDSFSDTIDYSMGLLRRFTFQPIEALKQRFAKMAVQTDQFNRRQSATKLGVDPFKATPDLRPIVDSWLKENVKLITSTQGKYLDRVEAILLNGYSSGLSPQAIAANLRKEVPVSKARAKFWARDQVAKLHGNLTQARQRALGINEYRWSTVKDERVRASHKAMEGKIGRWDDPSVYREEGSRVWQSRSSIGAVELHPGIDFQCRCTASAIIPEAEEAAQPFATVRQLRPASLPKIRRIARTAAISAVVGVAALAAVKSPTARSFLLQLALREMIRRKSRPVRRVPLLAQQAVNPILHMPAVPFMQTSLQAEYQTR